MLAINPVKCLPFIASPLFMPPWLSENEVPLINIAVTQHFAYAKSLFFGFMATDGDSARLVSSPRAEIASPNISRVAGNAGFREVRCVT